MSLRSPEEQAAQSVQQRAPISGWLASEMPDVAPPRRSGQGWTRRNVVLGALGAAIAILLGSIFLTPDPVTAPAAPAPAAAPAPVAPAPVAPAPVAPAPVPANPTVSEVFHRCNAQSAAYHANALAHTTDGWIQLAYGGLPPTSDLQDACAAGYASGPGDQYYHQTSPPVTACLPLEPGATKAFCDTTPGP